MSETKYWVCDACGKTSDTEVLARIHSSDAAAICSGTWLAAHEDGELFTSDEEKDLTEGPPRTEEELEEFEQKHQVVYFGLTAFMAHQLLCILEYDLRMVDRADRTGRDGVRRIYQLLATQMHGKDVIVTD